MSEDNIARAKILIQQERYRDAEAILKEFLSNNPNDFEGLMYLSQVNLCLNKLDKAEDLINSAIGLAPEESRLFYLKALILFHKEKYIEAEKTLKIALRFNPLDADYFNLFASIKLSRSQFKGAVRYVDKALALEPNNISSLNIKSSILQQQNKKEEFLIASEDALKENANDVIALTNYGWSILEKGNSVKALDFFRDALKVDPQFDHAKAGMKEALKVNNILYRQFIKCSDWIIESNTVVRIVLYIIFCFSFRNIKEISSTYRILISFGLPIVLVIYFIIYSKAVLPAFSNFFLQFHTYGKHLLDKNEIKISNFVGSGFLILLIGLALYFSLGNVNYLTIAAFGLALMLIYCFMFSNTKFKAFFIVYGFFLIVAGILSIFEAFNSNKLFSPYSIFFLVGFLAYPWVGLYFNNKTE